MTDIKKLVDVDCIENINEDTSIIVEHAGFIKKVNPSKITDKFTVYANRSNKLFYNADLTDEISPENAKLLFTAGMIIIRDGVKYNPTSCDTNGNISYSISNLDIYARVASEEGLAEKLYWDIELTQEVLPEDIEKYINTLTINTVVVGSERPIDSKLRINSYYRWFQDDAGVDALVLECVSLIPGTQILHSSMFVALEGEIPEDN